MKIISINFLATEESVPALEANGFGLGAGENKMLAGF
jgi:hypothetical protein